jgi:hypothetical protein
MTADRIMQTAFWALRLMAVNMTVSSVSLCVVRFIAGLTIRHGKPLQGYTENEKTGE